MPPRPGQQDATKIDVEETLENVEKTLDRVKALYEQYFLGMQKQPPTQLHIDVERKMRDLQQAQIRNTGLRYRFATLQQKFGSYNTYWRRTLRQIENGTYLRNLQKIGRDAVRTGAEIPEEILAAMPKLMREQVKRDREKALALRRRRQDATVNEEPQFDELDGEGEEAAAAAPAAPGRVRELPKNHHVLDDADGDLDFDKMFAAMQDDTQSDIPAYRDPADEPAPPPRPAPPPPSRSPGPPTISLEAAFQPTTQIPTIPEAPAPPPASPRVPTAAPYQPTTRIPTVPEPPPAQPSQQMTTRIPVTPVTPVTPPAPPRPGASGVRFNTPGSAPTGAPPQRPSQPNIPGLTGGINPTPVPFAAPTRPSQPSVPPPTPSGPQPRTRAGTDLGFAAAPPSRASQPSIQPPIQPPTPPERASQPAMPPPRPQVTQPIATTRPTSLDTGPIPVQASGPIPVARPTPVPRPTPRPATPPAGAPAMRPPPGMNDAEVQALHAKYLKAKEAVGQKAGPGSYEKLMQTINAQAPKIMEQYKAKGVEFSVVVKDNQVVIKAKPKT